MHIHEERLPGEDVTAVSADAKTVRLTLTSRHILTRTLGPGMSMFGDNPGGEDDLPEGFSPDAIAAFDAPYEEGDYEDEYDEEAAEAADALYRRLEELVEKITAEDENSDDDTYVFRTLGQMRRTTDVNGSETIEIEYTEDDSMENTRTVIAFTPSQNDRVSIIHDGPVMSSLVCERGVRHISAYKTPIAPFEVAVYAKRCDADLTFERGGYIELDYLVELRGMDIQRTCMTIDAICFN
ncbi:MAG: DUF1934 domain-containing protein [Clostridia bacterium]|nr:DUF1934 domain-containing protein [Clostridia bacterium]MBQ9997120.1 DUF1934 domain-containing protein [Clostridia bacterium]